IEGDVTAAIVKEPVEAAAAVVVIPEDLALGVDCHRRVLHTQGIVDDGVAAAAVEEAMNAAIGTAYTDVVPNDLARVVDALGEGFIAGQRIIEDGVAAAAVKKSMIDVGTEGAAPPDDLACVVDVLGNRAERARRIVDRGVGIGSH